MKVKELIIRLLDKPMNAEVMLCTDYDKEEVETHGGVRVVNSGVVFGIDKITSTKNWVYINFTDWREDE